MCHTKKHGSSSEGNNTYDHGSSNDGIIGKFKDQLCEHCAVGWAWNTKIVIIKKRLKYFIPTHVRMMTMWSCLFQQLRPCILRLVHTRDSRHGSQVLAQADHGAWSSGTCQHGDDDDEDGSSFEGCNVVWLVSCECVLVSESSLRQSSSCLLLFGVSFTGHTSTQISLPILLYYRYY